MIERHTRTRPPLVGYGLAMALLAGITCASYAAMPGQASSATNVAIQTPSLVQATRMRHRPAYPAQSIKAGETGTVLLKIRVGTDGAPAEVLLDKSSGHAALDSSAIEAARQWRFEPARRDGVAQTAWIKLPVTFSLDVYDGTPIEADQAKVTLRVQVAASGNPIKAEVETSSGNIAMDQAAIQAVMGQHFAATNGSGERWISVPVNFNMQARVGEPAAR